MNGDHAQGEHLADERYREQVDLIREVFLYAHRFNGRIFVIHVDDTVEDAPYLAGLVKDLVLLRRAGIRIILVAGAKRRIDDVLRRYGVPGRVAGGFRVEDRSGARPRSAPAHAPRLARGRGRTPA